MPLSPDPGDVSQLRESATVVQGLMREASRLGADLVHFPEGALTSPHKRVMSSTGPQTVGAADWDRADWTRLASEIDEIARLARELRLWVVVGAIHRSAGSGRPANCLYVISNLGETIDRYDERMLSKTKATFMYTAGREPVVFAARGLRFGCALGMETHYAELFAAYEELDVACVLFSTAGNTETPNVFAIEATGHAAANSFWVSYAGPTGHEHPHAGLATPEGSWAARCTTDTTELVIAEIQAETNETARAWRRCARAALHD
jgi:predicted amidohydrolase